MPTGRLLAMLAARAIALAACGSSSKPSSSGSADTQTLKYADCMRANGTPNVPDPSSNGALPNPTLPAFRAAEKACERLQPVGMHSGGPAAPTAAELRAALAFARSMRAHGFRQFPDPLTAYGRGFTLAPGGVLSPPSAPAGPRSGRRRSLRHQGLRRAASHGPAAAHLGQAVSSDPGNTGCCLGGMSRSLV